MPEQRTDSNESIMGRGNFPPIFITATELLTGIEKIEAKETARTQADSKGEGKLTRNNSSFIYRWNLQIHSKPAIAAALEPLLLEG